MEKEKLLSVRQFFDVTGTRRTKFYEESNAGKFRAVRTSKDADEILPDIAKHLREITSTVEKCDFVIVAHSSNRKSIMWEVHRALSLIQLELEWQITCAEILLPFYKTGNRV